MMELEVAPVFVGGSALVVGLLGSFLGGTAQSVVWFTVGAGLLLGVTLQIAAAIVALYLVVTTIPAFHPAHRAGGTTGGTRKGPVPPHAHVAPA